MASVGVRLVDTQIYIIHINVFRTLRNMSNCCEPSLACLFGPSRIHFHRCGTETSVHWKREVSHFPNLTCIVDTSRGLPFLDSYIKWILKRWIVRGLNLIGRKIGILLIGYCHFSMVQMSERCGSGSHVRLMVTYKTYILGLSNKCVQ
jgi:hypothetical protein